MDGRVLSPFILQTTENTIPQKEVIGQEKSVLYLTTHSHRHDYEIQNSIRSIAAVCGNLKMLYYRYTSCGNDIW